MTNAIKLIEELNPAEIRQRLDELEREQRALGVLLRAATRLGRQPGQASTPLSLSHASERPAPQGGKL